MLLHTGDGPSMLLSIPRDSLVEVPGNGRSKINSAFAIGGPRLLVQTIEQNTGIRIDHYIEIGFGGFVNMVDAVGGITICPETAMNDPQAELKISEGCQEADGKTALGYARSRKTQSLGDIDRARAQREVVAAVAETVGGPVRTLVTPAAAICFIASLSSSRWRASSGSGTRPRTAAARAPAWPSREPAPAASGNGTIRAPR